MGQMGQYGRKRLLCQSLAVLEIYVSATVNPSFFSSVFLWPWPLTEMAHGTASVSMQGGRGPRQIQAWMYAEALQPGCCSLDIQLEAALWDGDIEPTPIVVVCQ